MPVLVLIISRIASPCVLQLIIINGSKRVIVLRPLAVRMIEVEAQEIVLLPYLLHDLQAQIVIGIFVLRGRLLAVIVYPCSLIYLLDMSKGSFRVRFGPGIERSGTALALASVIGITPSG